MLNCKQVTQLVSDSMDKRIGLSTRIQLWMHLWMCGLCSRFRRAMLRIHREGRLLGLEAEKEQSGHQARLSVPARDRIRTALKSVDQG
jgi:hypothetical protein